MTGWSDSAGAQISGTGPLAYSSSKAALNRLTNALAPQLLAEGIVAELAHEEHTHHQVAGGTYEIRIQQEWDYLSEMARQVQD